MVAAILGRLPLVAGPQDAPFAAFRVRQRLLGRRVGAQLLVTELAAEADVGTLAPTLIGAAYLLYSDADGTEPDAAAVGRVVATVIAPVTR